MSRARRTAVAVLAAATCGWLAAHPLIAAVAVALVVVPLLAAQLFAGRYPEDRLAARDRRQTTRGVLR